MIKKLNLGFSLYYIVKQGKELTTANKPTKTANNRIEKKTNNSVSAPLPLFKIEGF